MVLIKTKLLNFVKTIIEAIEGGKEPIKVVHHILLTLGFL